MPLALVQLSLSALARPRPPSRAAPPSVDVRPPRQAGRASPLCGRGAPLSGPRAGRCPCGRGDELGLDQRLLVVVDGKIAGPFGARPLPSGPRSSPHERFFAVVLIDRSVVRFAFGKAEAATGGPNGDVHGGASGPPQNRLNDSSAVPVRHRFSAMSKPQPRHFSMIREFHLADLFTLANAACGTGAVLCVHAFLRRRDALPSSAGAALLPARAGHSTCWTAASPAGASVRRRSGRSWIRWPTSSRSASRPSPWRSRRACRAAWDALFWSTSSACGISRLARYNVTAESLSERQRQGQATSRARPSRPACCWWRCWPSWRRRDAGTRRFRWACVSIAGFDLHPLGAVFVRPAAR